MRKTDTLYFRFGGLTFRLSGWIPDIAQHDLLDPFLVPASPFDYDIAVYQDPTIDIPADGEVLQNTPLRNICKKGEKTWVQFRLYQSMKMWTFAVLHLHEQEPNVLRLQILQENCHFSVETILSSIMVESLLLKHGHAVLHSATIEIGGKAIMFSAPSGTGKSTQAALWEAHRGAEVINGDRMILLEENGVIMASGLPFAGSSKICKNKTLPVGAIVFLSQARENRVEPLPFLLAVKKLMEQISVQSWNREDIAAALNIAERTVLQVPVYHLACLPDSSAVEALDQVFSWD